MLPDQAFTSPARNASGFVRPPTWYISSWAGVCVVKASPKPDKGPFALINLAGGAVCPVSQAFDVPGTPERKG